MEQLPIDARGFPQEMRLEEPRPLQVQPRPLHLQPRP